MQFSVYENLTASVGKTIEDTKMFCLFLKWNPKISVSSKKNLIKTFTLKFAKKKKKKKKKMLQFYPKVEN